MMGSDRSLLGHRTGTNGNFFYDEKNCYLLLSLQIQYKKLNSKYLYSNINYLRIIMTTSLKKINRVDNETHILWLCTYI